jgi:hypothetical protein
MAQTRWGANGMFFADAALTFAGIATLLLLSMVLRKPRAAAEAAPGT